MKRKLPPKYVPAAVGAGLLLFALVGWLAVVRPQQTKAASLSKEIESVQFQITQNRLLARPRTTQVAVRLADLFRLTKAMPNDSDMPGILLELNRVAGQSGITFESITPQGEVATPTYRMVPIEVVLTGNYYELSDMLYRLRNLVEVHEGELAATGRLFTIDAMHFVESSEKRFPFLEATMTVNAFIYGGAGVAGAPPTQPSTTPSESPSPGTSAAPSASGSNASALGVSP
jgi:Tfp pilus assembly protein PilO